MREGSSLINYYSTLLLALVRMPGVIADKLQAAQPQTKKPKCLN